VVFTPKSLLRHPAAVSTVEDLSSGAFQRVIPDGVVDPKKTKSILVCSGKVYYELAQARKERGREDVAILRLEQLYPISGALREALAAYPKGTPVTWVQDEPRNMGAWYFLNARKDEVFGGDHPLHLASRAESASPATGSKASHDLEQKMLLDEAFRR
jgi:2-oxoglutarate dehydrogenase E1 component